MSTYDIYGIGAALVDTEIEVSDTDLQNFGIEKGVMTLVDEARQNELIDHLKEHLTASKRASGGSAANSVIAASYFGASTFFSCKVASDDNGEFYLSDLENAGVKFHTENGSANGITGKCLVMITPDAERTMNTYLGISEALSVAEIDETALKASRFAYIEGYLVTSETGKPAALKLKSLAEQHQVKTAMSLSDPAIVNFFHDGISEIVGSGVDILFCNLDEALNFTKTEDLEKAAEALKAHAKSFAITLGADGAYIYDGSKSFTVEGHAVEAVDTNGAGDMFAGAFLYSLSQNECYEMAAKLACKAASVVVSQFGPRLAPEQHSPLLG